MTTNPGKSNSTQFLILRRRLDSIGYNDLPLGLDSAPLASRLLEDLVATTETLRDNEEEFSKVKAQVGVMEAQIEPLQQEISRLAREKTQLHQLLIKSREDLVKIENEGVMNYTLVQAENRKIKLVNAKMNDKVKELTKQVEGLKAKLKEVTETPASLHSINDNRSNSSSRRSSRRSKRNTTPSAINDGSSFASALDKEEMKTLKEEIEKLKQVIHDKDLELEAQAHTINESKAILNIRDEEILRIGAELEKETGKNGYLVTLRHKYAQQEVEIEKLRAQLRVTRPYESRRLKKFVRTKPKAVADIDIDEEISKLSSFVSNLSRKTKPTPTTHSEEDEVFVEEVPKSRFSSTVIENKTTIESEALEEAEKRIIKLKEKTNESKSKIKDLKQQIFDMKESLNEKDQIIAEMISDFIYIQENITVMHQEKEELIYKLNHKNKKLEEDITTNIESQFRSKLQSIRKKHEHQLEERIQEIYVLKDKCAALEIASKTNVCKRCTELEKELDIVRDKLEQIEEHNANVIQLKAKNAQLEALLQEAGESHGHAAEDQEKIAQLQNKLIATSTDLEETKKCLKKKETEYVNLKKLSEELEELANSVPDIKSRARVQVDRLNAEIAALKSELTSKNESYDDINSKLIENQKVMYELQNKVQSMKQEVSALKDETKFHRSKSEEVQTICANKIKQIQTESQEAITKMSFELQEKTRTCELLEKLVAKERVKAAPLMEVEIPKLNAELGRLKRERTELSNRVNSLIQLAQFTEKTVEFSPTSVQLVTALHKLADDLRPFAVSF